MNRWQTQSSNKIIAQEHLQKHIALIRGNNETIATVNGAFDLLHAGHLYFLFEAAAQADHLFVALNSDQSIKRYKSKNRPIVPLEQRLNLIAALECVSFVTWFDEKDPRSLLSLISPDVHVNGEEYGTDCIEAETIKKGGGRLHLMPRIPNYSTTTLIETVKTSL